jgi:predicted transposase YdaD
MEKGLPGLLPLVPLAKGGAKREVIEQVIARLAPPGGSTRKELLALTRLFASLALKSQEDQIWLRRRFDMLRDILRETPAYQEILEEGREEGLEKGLRDGLEEGLAKGREQERQRCLQSLREKLLKIVQTRFPRLKTSAKGLVAVIEQPEKLEDLLIRVASASTTDEAREAFITTIEQEGSDEPRQ